MKTAAPAKIGVVKFLKKAFLEVLPQTSNGPTPVRNNKTNPMGAFTLLKNGAPTVIFSPRMASDRTGKIVPQNTEKHITTNITLFRRKPLSREVNDSILFSFLRNGYRSQNKMEQIDISNKINIMNAGPRSETANE